MRGNGSNSQGRKNLRGKCRAVYYSHGNRQKNCAGDRIHIYCVEQEEEEQNGKLLWENVFVQQVFDRNGAAIGGDDGTTPAQRVNIYMEKERVADFYAALAQGSLRVVKAEDTDRQEE